MRSRRSRVPRRSSRQVFKAVGNGKAQLVSLSLGRERGGRQQEVVKGPEGPTALDPDVSDASGLDLSDFAWTEEDFTKCDLPGANLSSCDFNGARFEGAELWNTDLSDSDLTAAKKLLPAQPAATDLKRAKLPEALTKFEALEASAKLADNASKVFLTILGAVAFTFLTLATTTDVQLFANSSNTKLPVIGTDVAIQNFYWVIPIVLLALFIYFHIYLQRLWEALAALPAVFPDGRRLDEKSHPWLLTDLVRRHLPRLQKKGCRSFETAVRRLDDTWVLDRTGHASVYLVEAVAFAQQMGHRLLPSRDAGFCCRPGTVFFAEPT